jgi:hypothetical protein
MMKRIALWLGVGLLVTACAGAPKSGATSASAEAASQPTPPVVAGPADGDPARLIPVQSEALGVSFAYPEQEPRPEVEEVGGAMMSLTLRFSTWEFVVVRKEPAPGEDLAALAKEHMDANTQASRGRIVSTDLGEQTLGGVPAWAVSSYFDSAAGRRDGLFYIVLKGPYQYGISCGTKQGPPVVPWESVRPLCEQALATVSFDAPVDPPVRLNDGQVQLPEGIVGTIPSGLSAAGLSLLLDGVHQETAAITFAECPANAPDSGCVGNHRAVSVSRTVTVGGKPASQFEAIFQQPAAANDPRSWLELHTVVTMPSGRKVDIIGQALDGSGAAPRLRATYAELLESLRLEK